MGGGGKGGGGNSSTSGLSPEIQQGLLANQTALVDIAKGQAANAESLFNLTEPGLKKAEDFYGTLAAGDPAAILRATAPIAEQTAQSAAGSKSNILVTAPSGGERNLALESVDVNRGATVGRAATGEVLQAPRSLAQLAGQGVGESISAAGTGISGLAAGNQALSSLGGIEVQNRQVNAEEKGSVLGSLSSLAGTGVEAGALLAL
jgi:hypothetical protein